MTETNNLKLKKFEATDPFDYNVLNENADVLDGVVSNRNLLDNAWFVNPVNQRGQTSGSTYGYMFDRWIFDFGTSSSWNWIDNQIQIHKDGRLIQKLEHGLAGKTVTFSYIDYLDRINSGTAVLSNGDTEIFNNGELKALWAEGRKALYIYNIAPSEHSVGIKAVKLEYGSVSTIANDHAPDYATELLKCQRYFQILNGRNFRPYAYNPNQISFSTKMIKMRISDAVLSFSDNFKMTNQYTIITGFSFSTNWNGDDSCQIIATKNSHGISSIYTLSFAGECYLSADL